MLQYYLYTCNFEIKFSAFCFSSLFAAFFQLSKIYPTSSLPPVFFLLPKPELLHDLSSFCWLFLPVDCHAYHIILQIFSFIDVEKSGTITFRQVTICNNLPCLWIRSSNWYYKNYTISFFVQKTAIQGSKCPCWLHHLFLIVCCFQFLYGSAHVMSQPGFHQACEEAFAGCGGAVKAYVVEQEVL